MSADPDYDAARGYGHAILDGVSAFADGGGELMDLATQRALEVDAFKVTRPDDDETDLQLDVSAAIGGSCMLVQTLITMLHEASGEHPDVILANARERFDRICRA